MTLLARSPVGRSWFDIVSLLGLYLLIDAGKPKTQLWRHRHKRHQQKLTCSPEQAHRLGRISVTQFINQAVNSTVLSREGLYGVSARALAGGSVPRHEYLQQESRTTYEVSVYPLTVSFSLSLLWDALFEWRARADTCLCKLKSEMVSRPLSVK